MNSLEIGIDLEGNLSKEGRVTMIQLNNTHKIYLIDYLTIEKSENKELLEKVNYLMKKLMTDENILKIFHYCKQDSVALHYIVGTCINNIFDTSAVDSLLSQLKVY